MYYRPNKVVYVESFIKRNSIVYYQYDTKERLIVVLLPSPSCNGGEARVINERVWCVR